VSAVDKVRASWNGAPPAWVEALAQACDRDGQRRAGARTGYSAAVVNAVLANTYHADTARIEEAVSRAFGISRHDCPVLGPITLERCAEAAEAEYDGSNWLSVALFRACLSCPKNGGGS